MPSWYQLSAYAQNYGKRAAQAFAYMVCLACNFSAVQCRFLWFPPEQHPIVCQLGGSNPETLAAAAKVVAKYGYDEINLNCGCPSERVAGAGCFGAAMMLQPQLVADCCRAMQDAVPDIPVTVKCRLGKLSMPSSPVSVPTVPPCYGLGYIYICYNGLHKRRQ